MQNVPAHVQASNATDERRSAAADEAAQVLPGSIFDSALDKTSSQVSEEIDADAIWDPLEGDPPNLRVNESIEQCRDPIEERRLECAAAVMEELGATQEAIEFLQGTGWFLTDFQETGRVDLGSLINPWRANSNSDYALLNGTPKVVVVEDALQSTDIDVAADPNYDDLVATYPELSPWLADSVFEGAASSSSGQRFVFQVELVDGCHACGTGYMSRIALDVAPDGTYETAAFLGICWWGWPDFTPATAGVPDCPDKGAAGRLPATGGSLTDRPTRAKPELAAFGLALSVLSGALLVSVCRRRDPE